MKSENMKNKRKILIAGFAGVAAIILAVSIYQQSIVASPSPTKITLIDFTAFPERDVIEVAKGQAVTVPIIVESPREADYTLKIRVYPDRISGNPLEDGSIPNVDPAGLVLLLDKEAITLSSENAVLREFLGDTVWRDSGAVLTVIAAPEVTEGTYSYILEADLPGLGQVRKVFTVTVN
jgi:hypothetical protein